MIAPARVLDERVQPGYSTPRDRVVLRYRHPLRGHHLDEESLRPWGCTIFAIEYSEASEETRVLLSFDSAPVVLAWKKGLDVFLDEGEALLASVLRRKAAHRGDVGGGE